MDPPNDEKPTLARRRPALPKAARYILTVTSGPAQGASVVIEENRPAPVLVGTGTVCELRIPDALASRRHAAVDVVRDQLRVRDLGSTNGTFYAGCRVGEVWLSGAAQLFLGDTIVDVQRHDGGPPTALSQKDRFGALLGRSPAMRRLYPLCERLAAASVPILIEGETGVGKEQLAEALHAEGPRRKGPFVILDCTAVAPSLIESELFGHAAGAFTGARGAHAGVFEAAHGGTLFIDEVGDMPLALQPKLLRAIERLSFRPVGGTKTKTVDVRIIAATRRDLDQEIQRGRFRDDLFHRLAVARVLLPPLRERRGDVEFLARTLWRQLGGDPGQLDPQTLATWNDDEWPGNVRQLRNVIQRRLALGDLMVSDDASGSTGERQRHRVADGGDVIKALLALDLPLAETRQRMVAELEHRYVKYALDRTDGDLTRAAAMAGVAPRHFRRLRARLTHAESSETDA